MIVQAALSLQKSARTCVAIAGLTALIISRSLDESTCSHLSAAAGDGRDDVGSHLFAGVARGSSIRKNYWV